MRTVRGIWLLVHTAFSVTRGQSLLALTETVGVLLSVAQPVILAWLVAAVIRHDLSGTAMLAVALMIIFGVSRALFAIGLTARIGQLERLGYHFETRIAALTSAVPTLDHLDDPEYLDQIQILHEEEGSLGLAVNQLLNALNTSFSVVGTVALAITADPRLLLVALAGLPMILITPIIARWEKAAEEAGAEPGRLSAHLLDIATHGRGAGEIRVFALADQLRLRLADASAAWRQPKVAVAIRTAAIGVVAQIIFYLAAAGVLAWLLADLLAGQVGLAEFTLALLLISRLQQSSSQVQGVLGNLAALSRTAGRFLWLTEFAERATAAHAGVLEPPHRFATGIDLVDVSYTYPQNERPALAHVTVRLEAGSTVAIVGENGAGKSTLTNLIAGLSLPTTGDILIDGEPLTEFDLTAWRKAVTAAFQDHVRFEFTAADAIGIGDLDHRADDDRLASAIDAGTATSVIKSLPHGLDSQLGTTWTDGVDLSGGQWQRLAIARGMMRPRPLVRLLDEPTAALDAATEHAIFTRYIDVSQNDRGRGTITVLVTHRFSTVGAADLIIVLDEGRMIESGTHEHLMRAGGHYAELYRLQAKGYV